MIEKSQRSVAWQTERASGVYGERGLAGKITQVNIFQDFLTLEYGQEKLSRSQAMRMAMA